MALAAPVLAADDAPFRVELNAGPLDDALRTLAVQSGTGILSAPDVVAGRQARRVAGQMDLDRALRRLLAGSGLAYRRTAARTIVIYEARKMAARRPPDLVSQPEEIIVAGALRSAALKRDSAMIVNPVTELEAKRFPNMSVSDVLIQLPGIRRNETQSGENRYVSIRGLNNAAASQSIDGVLLTNHVARSRATSTEVLTPAFFKTFEAIATGGADIDENANGGHIALATISGLDGGGQRLFDIRLSVGDSRRAHSEAVPLRGSATWRGKLDGDGRIGLALGAVFDRLRSTQDAVSIARYSDFGGGLVPDGLLTRGETRTRTERRSAMARLDWHPTDGSALFAEYFYFAHRFATDQRTSNLAVDARQAMVGDDGRGRFVQGMPSFGFNYLQSPDIRDHIVQIRGDLTPEGRGLLSFRAGVTFNRVHQDGVATGGFAGGASTLASPLAYDVSRGGIGLGPLDGLAGDSLDPFELGGAVTVNRLRSRDRNLFGRMDYAWNGADGDNGLGIKAGAQIKTLDRRNRQYGFRSTLPAGTTIRLSEVAHPGDGPPAWDRSALLDLIARRGGPVPDANGLYAADPADGHGQDFDGSEQVAGGYGILSYREEGSSLSVGVRAMRTRRTLDALEPDIGGVWGPVRYRQHYWNLLPSLSAYQDLDPRWKLRFALSRTLERPAINGSAKRIVTSYDTPVTRSISYSSPYLKPIRSSNIDAAAEYYYGDHNAYVALTLFRKYLRDIPAVSSTRTIGADGVVEILSYLSNVRRVNGQRVYGLSRGVELAWSDPQLGFFPPSLGNLGVTLSYAYIRYRTTAVNGGDGVAATDTRLVDAVPRHYFNLNLYHVRGPFSANLFVQKQSSLPIRNYDPAQDRRTRYGALVDAQLGYALSPRARIVLEGRNLLDQAIVDSDAATGYRLANQVRHNGRTIWLGAQFSLF
jgi:TonB-dependent receptor